MGYYKDLVDWVERRIDKDFKTVQDLKDFIDTDVKDDLEDDGRKPHCINLINRWVADTLGTDKGGSYTKFEEYADAVFAYNSEYIADSIEQIDITTSEAELEKIENESKEYEEDTQDAISTRIEERKSQLEAIEEEAKEEEVEEEPEEEEERYTYVEVEGVEIEIPEKFRRGRPPDQVRQVTLILIEETLDEIESAETEDELDEIEIPDDIPSSAKRMLRGAIRDAKAEYI